MNSFQLADDERLVFRDRAGRRWHEAARISSFGTLTLTDKRIVFRSRGWQESVLRLGFAVAVFIALVGPLVLYVLRADNPLIEFVTVPRDPVSWYDQVMEMRAFGINGYVFAVISVLYVFLSTLAAVYLSHFIFARFGSGKNTLEIMISDISNVGVARRGLFQLFKAVSIERPGHSPVFLRMPFTGLRDIIEALRRSTFPGKRRNGLALEFLQVSFVWAIALLMVLAIPVAILILEPEARELFLTGETALHRSASTGDLAAVSGLLERREDVNAPGLGSLTPLHLAAWNGRRAVVAHLLANGAQVDARTSFAGFTGQTPLHLAAAGGHGAVVAVLLASGADVNARGDDEETALHAAAGGDHREVAGAVLAAGADVNATNGAGDTPLHVAADAGSEAVATLLIAAGAVVSARNREGETPLHAAAAAGRRALVEFLLAAEADVNATDQAQETPLHKASRRGHEAVADVLRAAGGR